jgi:hypothetical protein
MATVIGIDGIRGIQQNATDENGHARDLPSRQFFFSIFLPPSDIYHKLELGIYTFYDILCVIHAQYIILYIYR